MLLIDGWEMAMSVLRLSGGGSRALDVMPNSDIAMLDNDARHDLTNEGGIPSAGGALRGEIALLPGCLQRAQAFDLFKATSLAGIGRAAGAACAARVAESGFESIHRLLDADGLVRATDDLGEAFQALAPTLVARIAREDLGWSGPLHLERYPNVRFHVPYASNVRWQPEFSAFVKRGGEGKLTLHGPHIDSWHGCPVNGVNIWVALGPVRPGNGLTIFPEAYGRRIARTSLSRICREQRLGRGLAFTMEPGDALVFHGEQLHASELNVTDLTRYVISFRVTFGDPRFRLDLGHSYLQIGEEACHASVLKRMRAGIAPSVRSVGRAMALGLAGLRLRSAKGTEVGETAVDAALALPAPVPLVLATVEELRFPGVELRRGSIRPLSPTLCVTRLDDGRVAAFGRVCPHEGADLAGGEVRGGLIVCPWHALLVDPFRGTSSCSSLRTVSVHPCVEEGDVVTVALAETPGPKAAGPRP